MRVGFSYVIGAPNPLTAPIESPKKACLISHTPQEISNWVKVDINEWPLNGAVARYGYGWVFLDICKQESIKDSSIMKDAILEFIQDKDEDFCSFFVPICSNLYTAARNKVPNIFECYQRNKNVRVDAIMSKENMEDFVDSLFYAYGGRLDITKGESYFYLPLCKASIRPFEAVYQQKPIGLQILNAQVVGQEGCRIFSGSLIEGRYGTYGKSVPSGFHLKGLRIAL